MQINEIVGQVRQLARLPEMDEAAIAKRAMHDKRAKRAGEAPRAVAAGQPKAAVGPKHNPPRFGAGF